MIVIYSKDNCPFCEKAVNICETKGLDYSVNKVGVDVQIDEFKELFPSARTVPQIVNVDQGVNHHIGGCDDFEEWVKMEDLVIKDLSL